MVIPFIGAGIAREHFGLGADLAGAIAEKFEYPFGIAGDSTGNVYVADDGNDRIQQFTSNGNFIRELGSEGNGTG